MRYLVVNFNSGLGNTILFNSSLKFLKDNFKVSEISIISNNRDNDLDLSDINLDIDHTINLNNINLKKKVIFFFRLFTGYYDFIIFTPFSSPSVFIFFLFFIFGRAKLLIPTYYKKLNTSNRFLIKKILIFLRTLFASGKILEGDLISKDTHEIQANLHLISKISSKKMIINEKYFYNSLNLNFSENILINNDLKKNLYVCIQYGGSHGNLTPKLWSQDKTNLLINKISKIYKVVILGNSKDRQFISTTEKSLNVINLIGKTNLTELSSLLKFSKKNICFDSGIMHLSDAIHSNLIAIFGPTNINKNKPKNPNSISIYKKLYCSPCILGWNFVENYISEKEAYNRCKINFECMNSINIDEIINQI